MNLIKKFFRSGVVVVVLSSLLSTVFISPSSASTPGELDASFGTGGKVTTAIGTTLSGSNIAEAMSVVMDSNGKIVVAGYAYFGSNVDFALARYLSNGTLDTSFGTGGIVTTPVGTASDTAQSIAIDSSGKIVVAGYVLNGLVYDIAVVRYLSNGDLDLSFSTDGKVTTAIGTASDLAFGMAIDANGKIVVTGYSENGPNDDVALARYNSNGTLDSSFGTGGIVTTSIRDGDNWGRALTFDSNGKIVIVGFSETVLNFQFAVLRLNVEDSAAIAAAEAARVAAAAEAARVAAAAEAAKKAQEQKELLAILGLLPPIGGISVNVGDLAKSLLSTKCTKGKSIKYVKKGTKCPKGYARKK